MKKMMRLLAPALVLAGTSLATSAIASPSTCADLPSRAELEAALQIVVTNPNYPGGLHSTTWLTLLDSSGIVCAVISSVGSSDDITNDAQLAHRVSSAYKASTANIFSNKFGAVASGQLYSHTEEGGQLYGFSYGSPINILAGDVNNFGTAMDPMVGKRVGGFLASGGGLTLFNEQKYKVGAIGVAGDTICTSHVLAWQIRQLLRNGAYSVTHIPGGLSAENKDQLIQDIDQDGRSASSYGHPRCVNNPTNDNDDGAILGN